MDEAECDWSIVISREVVHVLCVGPIAQKVGGKERGCPWSVLSG